MKTYNKAVSFYKLIFTLYVVAYHSCVMVQDRSVALFRGGWLAVELFFVISGYLMVHSATKTAHDPAQIGRETFQFVVHKISRLFPYYLVRIRGLIYLHAPFSTSDVHSGPAAERDGKVYHSVFLFESLWVRWL